MKSVEWFKKKDLLMKIRGVKRLSESYMEKARDNLITMELLDRSKNYRNELELPEDYDPSEWVVISGYYAMYLSALSVLAKLGYKSKNHTATVRALEELLVNKKMLEERYLDILKEVKFKKDEIESLDKVKSRREIAQYSVTKETTRRISEKTKNDARNFVDRMERLLDLLELKENR